MTCRAAVVTTVCWTSSPADLEQAGFEAHVVEDVMRWKYRKLLTNLGNAVQALVGPDAEGAAAVSTRLRQEGAAVLAHAGIEYASADEEDAWRKDLFVDRAVPGEPAQMGGSTWQSLARGTDSNEADYLNGEIAAIARAHGSRAPLNARVQALVRQASSPAVRRPSAGPRALHGGRGPGARPRRPLDRGTEQRRTERGYPPVTSAPPAR